MSAKHSSLNCLRSSQSQMTHSNPAFSVLRAFRSDLYRQFELLLEQRATGGVRKRVKVSTEAHPTQLAELGDEDDIHSEVAQTILDKAVACYDGQIPELKIHIDHPIWTVHDVRSALGIFAATIPIERRPTPDDILDVIRDDGTGIVNMYSDRAGNENSESVNTESNGDSMEHSESGFNQKMPMSPPKLLPDEEVMNKVNPLRGLSLDRLLIQTMHQITTALQERERGGRPSLTRLDVS